MAFTFQWTTVLMLAGIIVLAGVSGMFVFATGEEVANSPLMKMVSHTEYRFGESGQIIARLVDFQGNPVVVDTCNATILYPNKSYFVNAAGMTESGNISGDHYYEFTTPQGPEGVYEYQATCYYTVGAQQRNASVTNSFHLSGAFNTLINETAENQALLNQINTTLGDFNFTVTTNYLEDINTTVSENAAALLTINSTTTNTYQYLTGTLTNSVNQILTDLGVINATVNRIETTTTTINSTVNTIQQNQENEVHMTVFSG